MKSFTHKCSYPSPSGRGRREAPGEGRAKREPDRAKPQEKSIRVLRPSPCPLPEGEGGSSAISIPDILENLRNRKRQHAVQTHIGNDDFLVLWVQHHSEGFFERRLGADR